MLLSKQDIVPESICTCLYNEITHTWTMYPCVKELKAIQKRQFYWDICVEQRSELCVSELLAR